ncbi:glutathione hydrolase-like YwrD proenzyme [Pelobates fuscus]|uniref:glutathione hydrolase-like YwrD proenzyme n=1 Tax=Pelobates fuscus TaxID=191477 RepID=UPI002FE4A955
MTNIAAKLEFNSRRSPIVCTGGCVASSQPLATNIGLDVLKRGGNAADAAVAVATALNVTEPCSTGIGGDCFCLYFNAEDKKIYGLNGSGMCPRALSIELLKEQGFDEESPLPPTHAHNVTVPGAAAAWVDTVSLFGSKKLTLGDILQPAIRLAEDGFPVSEVSAYLWNSTVSVLQDPRNKHGTELLVNGQAPQHGQIFKNPFLANTFKTLSEYGKQGFYQGWVAEAIIKVLKSNGGVMELEDLASHVTEEVQPIYTTYKDINVWELPPNGQGITVLMALNLLEQFSVQDMGHNSADYIHVLTEALKLCVSDCQWYCTDPRVTPVPTAELLSKFYSERQTSLIDLHRASTPRDHGNPFETGRDTVYFTVVDSQGNACSFINSVYMNFGTGLVPENCGFTLQNRGNNFSLSPSHPNCLAPGKRPFHTIIPAMATATTTQDLLCSFGVMGGFMQPQGHIQVLFNMAEYRMNPQQAVDAPRFYVEYSKKDRKWQLFLEDGILKDVAEELQARGHEVHWPVCGHDRKLFGRGQIICQGDWWQSQKHPSKERVVWWAGSDPRGDGCAMGYCTM